MSRFLQVAGGWCAVVGICVAAVSVEAVEISVRGESDLNVAAHQAGTTVELRGLLRDDLGEPIPQQSVRFAVVDGHRSLIEREVLTDFYGYFASVVELDEGEYDVEFDYPGASHVAGTEEAMEINVESAPVVMDVDAPRWVHGTSIPVPLQMEATVDGAGLPTYVTVAIDGSPIASTNLDGNGQGRFDIGPYLQQGDNDVMVRVEPTEYRAAAGADTTIRGIEQLEVDGAVERVFERSRRGWRVDVDVRADDGPLADIDVDIRIRRSERESGEADVTSAELVETVTTDREGGASVVFDDDQISDGRWEVSGHVSPPRGEEVAWRGESFVSTSLPWLKLGRLVAIFVLIFGAGWFARGVVRRGWSRFRQWIWQRWRSEQSETPESQHFERFDEPELLAVEDQEVSSETRDTTAGLVVQLWDEWRGEPLGEAVVTSELTNGDCRTFEANDDGMVELPAEASTPGTVLETRADGFVPARTRISEGGSAGMVRLEMTAVPLKIRRAYRSVVQKAQSDLWGRLTPRQIAEVLHSTDVEVESFQRWGRLDDEMRIRILIDAVTAVVEETNYSGRDYDRVVWERTRMVLNRLLDELDGDDGGKR